MYYIGKIIKPHGLKGSVKILPETDFNRFTKGKNIYYLNNNNEKVFLTIENVKKQTPNLIVSFSQFNKLEEVENLKNILLYTDEKPQLKSYEFTLKDLIGLDVYTDKNIYIGKVNTVLFLPKHEVFEIITKDKKVLIPNVSEFIHKIEKDKIIIKPISGML